MSRNYIEVPVGFDTLQWRDRVTADPTIHEADRPLALDLIDDSRLQRQLDKRTGRREQLWIDEVTGRLLGIMCVYPTHVTYFTTSGDRVRQEWIDVA